MSQLEEMFKRWAEKATLAQVQAKIAEYQAGTNNVSHRDVEARSRLLAMLRQRERELKDG